MKDYKISTQTHVVIDAIIVWEQITSVLFKLKIKEILLAQEILFVSSETAEACQKFQIKKLSCQKIQSITCSKMLVISFNRTYANDY